MPTLNALSVCGNCKETGCMNMSHDDDTEDEETFDSQMNYYNYHRYLKINVTHSYFGSDNFFLLL